MKYEPNTHGFSIYLQLPVAGRPFELDEVDEVAEVVIEVAEVAKR